MTAILNIMHLNHDLNYAATLCHYTVNTVKKHGRHRGMRDLNEIGTSMGQITPDHATATTGQTMGGLTKFPMAIMDMGTRARCRCRL